VRHNAGDEGKENKRSLAAMHVEQQIGEGRDVYECEEVDPGFVLVK
jgi:hypothetical protein